MIKGGRRSRFLDQPFIGLLVSHQCGWQKLHRDLTTKLHIFGEVDLTHTALAKLRADFIPAKFCAGRQRHLECGGLTPP